jgi:hypothetical protein
MQIAIRVLISMRASFLVGQRVDSRINVACRDILIKSTNSVNLQLTLGGRGTLYRPDARASRLKGIYTLVSRQQGIFVSFFELTFSTTSLPILTDDLYARCSFESSGG